MSDYLHLLSRISAFLAVLGLACGLGMIVLCLLAGLFPLLDEFNHFQPFWLMASMLTLGLAWLGANPARLQYATALVACNTVLFLAPILRLPAISTPVAANIAANVSPPGAGTQLKILTFNMFVYNNRPERLAELILAEAPDIVVLQEATRDHHIDVLNRLLRDAYPWRRFCVTGQCDGAMLSKRPWLEFRQIERGDTAPPSVSARFDLGNGRMLRIVGTHLWNPKAPRRQLREIEWLGRELGRINDLVIVGGDFNFTPWTFALNRFEHTARLVRHSGVGGTWRVSRYYPAMFPIDHIFASPGIRLVSIARGPSIGSDHLAVIATLQLP